MNVNAEVTADVEIDIDVSELASELIYETEFTEGVESVVSDVIDGYVIDSVQNILADSDNIEDAVLEVLSEHSEKFRGLVAEAMLSIMQDNITY